MCQAVARRSRIPGPVDTPNHLARVLTVSPAEIDAAGRFLAQQCSAIDAPFLSAGAIARATSGVAGLTDSVRATAEQAERMTDMAAGLARRAFAAREATSALDARTAALRLEADRIGALLRGLGSAGGSAAPGSNRQPAVADALALLDELQALLDGHEAEVARMDRDVAEIGSLTHSLHEAGQSVGQALARQGFDMVRLLQGLMETRPGMASLRAGIEAVTLPDDADSAAGRSPLPRNAQVGMVFMAPRGMPGTAWPGDISSSPK